MVELIDMQIGMHTVVYFGTEFYVNLCKQIKCHIAFGLPFVPLTAIQFFTQMTR